MMWVVSQDWCGRIPSFTRSRVRGISSGGIPGLLMAALVGALLLLFILRIARSAGMVLSPMGNAEPHRNGSLVKNRPPSAVPDPGPDVPELSRGQPASTFGNVRSQRQAVPATLIAYTPPQTPLLLLIPPRPAPLRIRRNSPKERLPIPGNSMFSTDEASHRRNLSVHSSIYCRGSAFERDDNCPFLSRLFSIWADFSYFGVYDGIQREAFRHWGAMERPIG